MKRTRVELILSAFFALPLAGIAQQAQTPASTGGQTGQRLFDAVGGSVIQSTSQEVLLDVIVRDKKGKSLRDLEAKDFHVTDNGEPVQITHFRLVDHAAGAVEAVKTGATATAPVRLDPLRQIRLVTLIFDHLGQDGRLLSRQAALELIKGNPEPNVYYAIFEVDQMMNALQAFTNDRELLRKAILHATAGAYTEYASDSARIHDDLQRIIGAPAGADGLGTVEQIGNIAGSSPGPQGQGAAAFGGAMAQQQMAQMMLNMMQMDQAIANDANRLSIYGLLALVREQYRLPGRKTVVYFCEGFFVPPYLENSFQNIIGAANRSNVSVYAVDARGLQTSSQNRSASEALQSAADSSRRQARSTGGDKIDPDEVKVFDKAQDSSRKNSDNALANLSSSTGGFLISNTNDLKKPLRQVDEDISLYYEMSYTPPIRQYDGTFRKIAVKLDRPDVKIQSRLGYFALPPDAGPTISPFELPLLTALQSDPLPKTLDYRAAVLHFQPGKDVSRCAIVVQVPMKQLTTMADSGGASIRAHLGLVALVKDAKGAVVRKFSQDLPLQVTNDKKAALAAGDFTFNRAFDAAPGDYTLETAVGDFEGNKAGAQKVPFAVPAPATGVRLSNAALIRSFAKQPSVDAQDPFSFQAGKITPSLESHMRAQKGAVMSLYFVVYPDPAIAEKPKVLVQYLQGATVLGSGQLDLPAPDKDGKIPYVTSSPIENFPAGDYAVKVIAQQGSTSQSEQIKFTIEK